MARIFLARISGIPLAACLVFGVLAAVEQPSSAQITEKCWKEYCVYDPAIQGDRCVKQQITCPPQT
jgi:hypothetical protein